MKEGRSLQALAAEILRQQETKRDFVAATAQLELTSQGVSRLALTGAGEFALTDYAHSQLRSFVGIPADYYDRLRRWHPALLDQNVNTHLRNPLDLLTGKPKGVVKRMVRTLDGRARAFVSDRFNVRRDNFDVANWLLPVLSAQNLTVRSCEVTERHLYLKVVAENRALEVRVGDPVRAGVMIKNSEIGASSLQITPFLERLVCTNGMVVTDYAKTAYHVGRTHEGDNDAARELYRPETVEAEERAFWLKMCDIIEQVLFGDAFTKIVEKLRAAAEHTITGELPAVVEVAAQRLGLINGERTSVLAHLLAGADLTQYGLLNAITRTAEDAGDYDRATTLEEIGGQVLDLTPADWRTIGQATAAEAEALKPRRRALTAAA
jgi:hypothetical protein